MQPEDWEEERASSASVTRSIPSDPSTSCTAEPELTQHTCDRSDSDTEGSCVKENENEMSEGADWGRACTAPQQQQQQQGNNSSSNSSASGATEEDEAVLHGTFGWRMNTLLNSAEHGVVRAVEA